MDFFQEEFREGKLVEEATWQAVVLIPKGKKYYRGIGLVAPGGNIPVKIQPFLVDELVP